MCGRFGEAGCLARCGFAARAKGESGLANIVRDGLNHAIGGSVCAYGCTEFNPM